MHARWRLAAAVRRTAATYKLQGQILSVDRDRTQATIKHEEIPGFMSAMTMSYQVQDAKECTRRSRRAT